MINQSVEEPLKACFRNRTLEIKAKSALVQRFLKRYELFFFEDGRRGNDAFGASAIPPSAEREHMTERATSDPVTADPKVLAFLGAGNTSFKFKSWPRAVPETEIVNVTSVAQNVHTGERDHRTNQLEVISGETGVKLAKSQPNVY